MSLSSWKCARCGALTRTWSGVFRFAQPGTPKVGRPVCVDTAACRLRAQSDDQAEVWLAPSDDWGDLG